MVPWDLAEINEVKLRLLAALEKKDRGVSLSQVPKENEKDWKF